jgi:hypothetical protein
MCSSIYTLSGEELLTVQDAINEFGEGAVRYCSESCYDGLNPESCLCQIDIPMLLDFQRIEYYEDCFDYFITGAKQ